MMKLLSNVQKIYFRVNQYEGQSTYKLEDVRLEYVMPSDAPGTLNPEIESCKCPEGYKGLSCQVGFCISSLERLILMKKCTQ